MYSNAWSKLSPVPTIAEQRADHRIPGLRRAIELTRLARTRAVPRQRRTTVRIGRRKLGAESARPLLAGLRPAAAQRNDVVDWSHEVGRQVDVDHLGKVTRAHAGEPHCPSYITPPRSR